MSWWGSHEVKVFKKKLRFFIYLNLLIGSASKSNFWQYSNRVIKEMVIDFEIENNSFFIQVFDLFFGSASKSNFGQYVIAL